MTRSLLATVLTLFATTAGATEPLTADWGGVKATADNGVGAELHGLLAARWQLRHDDQATEAAAAILNARPILRVHGPENHVAVFFQTEWAGGARVLDARVDLSDGEQWQAHIGQQIVPFTRAWNTPLPETLLPERSQNNAVFAPGRRFGAWGQHDAAGGVFQSSIGVFDANVEGPPNDFPRSPLGMLRLQFNPLGHGPATELPSLREDATPKFSLGVAALVEPVVYQTEPRQIEATWLTSTIDAALYVQGFTVTTELFSRYTEEQFSGWGASAQLGQFVIPQRLQLIGRVTAIDEDADPTAATLEGGLAWYAQKSHVMGHLRYGYTDAQAPTHLLTAQAQLMF